MISGSFSFSFQIRWSSITEQNRPGTDEKEKDRHDQSQIATQRGDEPILQVQTNRYVMFPIKYHKLWEMYKSQQACLWTAEENAMASDAKEWLKLNPNEKHFIEHILAFFAASDEIVAENIALRFHNEVQIPEAKAFYKTQIYIENVHSET